MVKQQCEVVANEIAEITKLVNEENTSTKADNARKRELYVRSELARMDFEQLASVQSWLQALSRCSDPSHRSQLESLKAGQLIQRTLTDFDQLRALQAIPIRRYSLLQRIDSYFRTLLLFLYVGCCTPVMSFFIPFLYLHPLFIQLGIRQFQPLDIINRWFARGWLFICGVTVTLQNEQYNDDSKTSVLGMFTHASNFDPMLTVSGAVPYKFIAKKQLFKIPIIGWILAGYGHVPIDRENLETAKKSLDRAISMIRELSRSIAISPEGTRSKSGRVAEFKKGPFHTAMAVKLPIVPVLVDGAFELWPPHGLPHGGPVTVRYLPPIQVRDDDTYTTLSNRVRREILKGTLLNGATLPSSRLHLALYAAFFPACWIVTLAFFKWYLAY